MPPTQSERREGALAAIQAAALALFAERGFSEASIRAIAERAGVSKGLVHHYFPTKDALIIGVVSARQQAIAAQLAQAPPDLSPVQRIAWAAQRMIEDVARDPAQFRVLLRAICDPEVHARVQQLVAPSQGWSAAFQQTGVEDAEERARFFRAALLGVLTTLATSADSPDTAALTRQLVRLLPPDQGAP